MSFLASSPVLTKGAAAMRRARAVPSRSLAAIALLALSLPLLGAGSPLAAEPGTAESVRNRVVPTMQAEATSCPADWVCVWEHADFAGTMVQVHDCCGWLNFSDVGFNNMMSSWRNRKGVDAKVAENADGGGDRLCLNNGASDSWVGSAWNDRASSIKIFASSTAC